MEVANSRAPGPPALPLIGGLLQLRGDPLARIVELRAKHGGFIRLGPLGRRDVFLLTDPAAIRHVLSENHKNYRKGAGARQLGPILGTGSLLLEGEEWRRRRRLIQPAFHKQHVASLGNAFVDETDAMLERWRSQTGSIDARTEMLGLTMRLTLRNMFRATPSTLEPLIAAWNTLYDELSASRRRIARLPKWVPTKERARVQGALATIDRVLAELIAERQRTDDGSLLAMLIRARGENNEPSLTAKELRDEVMTIFVGGYETSSNALAFTVALLAAHPEVAARYRAEVDRAIAGRTPTAPDLDQLPLGRAILQEALRMFPPSWMITREAIADDVVAGFRVAAGSQLLISSYGVHHAPDLWPDPRKFDPDRFLSEAQPQKFSFLPFGGGPRVCLGEQYAMTEMQLALARIVQSVELRPVGSGRVEAEAHIGLRPRTPLRVVPTWR
ncbi:MAG TPA: cytochrome P450 [Kofleriaceae bacterium]|jgi:cytochrome P450